MSLKGDNSVSRDVDKSEKTHKMTYIIFVSLLLDLLAFTMILPLFPSLMDHYRRHDDPNGLYAYMSESIKHFQQLVGAPIKFNSVLFGGLLGSMFSFLQYTVSPIVGGLSDAYGRKPVLLITLSGIALSYLLWALSHNFTIFVLARVLGGLSKGNISLSMAAVADVSTPATRASGMALVGIAFSIGFVVGPMIGAGFAKWASSQIYSQTWFIIPALSALTLATLDILFVFLFFKETLPKEKRAKSVVQSLSQAASYINMFSLFNFLPVSGLTEQKRKELRNLGLIYFVYLFIYSGLEFTLTFLTHIHFNFTPMKQGMMFFCIGLTMAILQGGWVRRIKQENVKSTATVGLMIIVPSYIFVGLATSEIILYIGVFLFAVSTSVVVPCMTTLASQYGEDKQNGTVIGVFRSLGALARALGPIIASVAYWSLGPRTTYLIGSVGLLWPCISLKRSRIKQD
ncbi:major facilitator superfamily domain-containing protein 10 [Cimex lectularius]|uniref:Major facilitator superfamily (MFS) profile domain-containing protein n=1 Tax=Cimex lectularius TaxID=79782 RepID=A0A8I6R886_CIMLE|nr:major facilitator superfamily domain-containing protein 10 [Cimex lectularius]XP_024081528.1 major facilitator superfamily domain-containing protein 10 [Cimex lectularius]